MGTRARAWEASAHLEGPLIGMDPHVDAEGGVISKLLVADLTAVAGSGFGVAERPLDVGQDVLLQGGVGGEPAAAGPDGALERRLARVGHPVEVQALLGHAAVATEVTFNLRTQGTNKKTMEGSRGQEGQLQRARRSEVSVMATRSHVGILDLFSPSALLIKGNQRPPKGNGRLE